MIRDPRRSIAALRHVWLTLAVVAVTLKVLIPPGFMVAAPTNELPFALVFCTSQGERIVQPGETLPGHADHQDAPVKSLDGPCLFAGHGVGAPPPSELEGSLVQPVAYEQPQPLVSNGLSPGRGLAGPPLPARGPPALLITPPMASARTSAFQHS